VTVLLARKEESGNGKSDNVMPKPCRR
jgi:hypothetical protein